MEGKEVRFGIANSALYAAVTTAASCGAVNAMHDSFTPLGGLVPLVNMQLGEVIFGGVGAGLYGMLVMVVLTVFIAGLMVGRTPEYLGKKIQAREVQMAMLYVLIFPAVILVLRRCRPPSMPPGSRASTTPGRTGCPRSSTPSARRPATTAAPSPGSPGSTYYYNTLFGVATLIGRFAMIVPMLALARLPRRAEDRARDRGHVPGHDAALRGAARRRHPDRRRAHLLPGALARPDRRAPAHAEREALLAMAAVKHPLFDPPIVRRAMRDAVYKLEPAPHGAEPGDVRGAGRQRAHHAACWSATSSTGRGDVGFTLQLALWLWFTVLFANFAEAMAEGRGKAQADALRGTRLETRAKRLRDPDEPPRLPVGVRDRAARAATTCCASRATSSRPTAR